MLNSFLSSVLEYNSSGLVKDETYCVMGLAQISKVIKLAVEGYYCTAPLNGFASKGAIVNILYYYYMSINDNDAAHTLCYRHLCAQCRLNWLKSPTRNPTGAIVDLR